ncbi:MAG: hypothetical protein M0Z67_15195 [Nitrospiraceae bacterium]|nr:hypothetical protein [Nitrospiraceae bacterium]
MSTSNYNYKVEMGGPFMWRALPIKSFSPVALSRERVLSISWFLPFIRGLALFVAATLLFGTP